MKRILVTGAAGFIGAKTSEFLLRDGAHVVGVDNLNGYYDVRLKRHRLRALDVHPRFRFHRLDIERLGALEAVFRRHRPEAVINLAARAGVRYSMANPHVYMTTNAVGTLNLLEMARRYGTKKFVLASTSSLYAGQPMPFREDLPVNTPISPYAASKKSAEAMCYAYHYLYGLDVAVFRYFTVYGPAGRPDMSYFRFIRWIDEGRPLLLHGDGTQERDFTYVDDIADGTIKGLDLSGFSIVNLGNHRPYPLNELIRLIEKHLGKKARIKRLPFHKADMKATYADITRATRELGWRPRIGLEDGVRRTVEWYAENRAWARRVKLGDG